MHAMRREGARGEKWDCKPQFYPIWHMVCGGESKWIKKYCFGVHTASVSCNFSFLLECQRNVLFFRNILIRLRLWYCCRWHILYLMLWMYSQLALISCSFPFKSKYFSFSKQLCIRWIRSYSFSVAFPSCSSEGSWIKNR